MAIKTDRDMRKSKDFQELNVPVAERKRRGYVEDRELVTETKISFSNNIGKEAIVNSL